ncbi:MAG: hypothetical protein R3348_00185 [Xanthomonadales bacterium]|nr:hypothetical protein [Xanthomonadales bacterium]
MPLYISPPPRNPLLTAIGAVVGAVTLVGAMFLGFFVFLGVIAVFAASYLVARIRLGLAGRKDSSPAGGHARASHAKSHATRGSETIEAEYTVISRKSDD